MANFDLLNLTPTTISRDLKSKYVLIFSEPKAGKTSLATQIDKSLLVAFERGYNALAGIKKVDITSWSDFKMMLRQLKDDQVKDMYDVLIIDTASIAWERCTEYICNQNHVTNLTDMAYGKGYAAASTEFSKMFRDIAALGYGIVFLAHSEEKIPFGGSEEQGYIAPMLDKRPYKIINGMVDIIACIDVDKNTGERFLQMRSTPRIMAGS